ncbi:MAG: glycosyltransferase family 4 protein [Phycisphaerales bacterium]
MHISTRLILGGSQENTVLSCEGQADAGHTVNLVYGPIYGPEGSLLERVKQHGGIETIQTPNLVRDLSPLRDVRCYFDLKRIIAQRKPDVVHTHSSKAGILGRLAAWKARVPCVVHTIHGLAFHPYQKKWRNAIYIASERFAAQRCHRIVCVADAMRDQALAARIGRRGLYVTVYSGIETEPFVHPKHSRQAMHTELGLAEDDFVLGTIARLAELKGHDDLLDALSPMMHTHPNLKLLWVGDGWWRDRLMKRIQSLGLESQVVLTGLVGPQRIPECLGAMNVLVHPSYREGLPRAVPQALLSGVPAIVYDVDGAKEVCIDGEVGRLVPPGDLVALRDAVQWMMDHPKERQEMGQRGRERCEDRFAAAQMVKKLETIYAQVLAQRGDDRAGHRRDREP